MLAVQSTQSPELAPIFVNSAMAMGVVSSHNGERTAAILMPVEKCELPFIFVRCMPSRIFPKSVVKVVNTSGPWPPILIRPTDDSGFAPVLAEKIRLTVSA